MDLKSVLLQPANTVNYAAEILGCGEVARISASGVQRCGFRRGEQPRRLWYFPSQVNRRALGDTFIASSVDMFPEDHDPPSNQNVIIASGRSVQEIAMTFTCRRTVQASRPRFS